MDQMPQKLKSKRANIEILPYKEKTHGAKKDKLAKLKNWRPKKKRKLV